MKVINRITCTLLLATFALSASAQNDSIPSKSKSDTIRVGGLIIIKKKGGTKSDREVEISTGVSFEDDKQKKRKKSNVTTNVLSIDFGFTNYVDETQYGTAAVNSVLRPNGGNAAPGKPDFRLRSGKSVNVNVWLFWQKLNLIKHVVNLKYGLGLELNNYRYRSDLTFRDQSPSTVVIDTNTFSKNKLAVDYLTVPLMLTINPDAKDNFSISFGVSAGWRYAARNKQESNRLGKEKERGDFDLNPWKFALVGDIGYRRLRFYGSYSLTNLFDNALNFTPYTVGLRFSKW
jgi:hypothetical protein